MPYDSEAKTLLKLGNFTLYSGYYGEIILYGYLFKKTMSFIVRNRKPARIAYSGIDPVKLNGRLRIW